MSKKKRKYTQVSDTEIKTVEGVAGAKVGLAMASRMEMLKSPYLWIPVLMGSAAATMLPGYETNKKVKGAIKMVKEAGMDKAEKIFQKISKCKPKGNKKMIKKASMMGKGTAVLVLGDLAPKPRKTATTVLNPTTGKNVEMKKLVNLPKL